jgi:hypothetical protein
MDLERQLHSALSRKDPPASFAERVEAAANRPRPTAPDPRLRSSGPRPVTRWLAAAASIVLLAGSGAIYRHHQGEAAKQQLMTAMKLTAVQLNHIQTHVREVRQ